MSTTTELVHICLSDFLEGEQQSEIKHDYVGGQVYAMVGASDRHNIITGNLFAALHPHAVKNGCQLFISDMKAHSIFRNTECFYYPDIMLGCDPEDRHSYYRDHPCLIVEVLSNSTERLDRREKFFVYTNIDSLQEYILITQDKRIVEVFRRQNDWIPEVINEGELQLECIELAVSLDSIYATVD